MQVGHAVHAANDWATREEAGRWADVNVSMQHRGSTLWFSNLAVRYVGDSAGQRVFVMRD